jgi:hypothetical protein
MAYWILPDAHASGWQCGLIGIRPLSHAPSLKINAGQWWFTPGDDPRVGARGILMVT